MRLKQLKRRMIDGRISATRYVHEMLRRKYRAIRAEADAEMENLILYGDPSVKDEISPFRSIRWN